VFGVVVCNTVFILKVLVFNYISEVGHFYLILGCNDLEEYTRTAVLNLLKGK